MDTKVILGTAFVTDKGDWTKGTSYEENDIVHTTDGVYMSLVDNNTAETTDTSKWRLWVDKADVNAATEAANTAAATANTAATTIDDKIATKAAQTDLDATNAEVAKKLNKADFEDSEWYEDQLSYGVEWDTTVSSPTLTRIGNLALHKTLPVQSLMRGCLLADDGSVNKYLNASSWTSETRDGSAGQVMVELPAHYIKFRQEGTKRSVRISLYPLNGYTYMPKKYVSAYQARLIDSKLSSCTGGTASSNISRTDFRTYARNRGNGMTQWNCMVYGVQKTIYWFFCIEYATFNCQASYNAALTSEGYRQGGLGDGVSTWDWGAWSTYNGNCPIIPCGTTDSLGNSSGVVSYTASGNGVSKTFSVPRYRGIENPYADTWEWTDGVNVEINPTSGTNLSRVFVCNDPAKFTDSSYDGYTYVGNEARSEAFATKHIFGDGGEIIPSEVGGSATTYMCDYHYTSIPSSTTLRGVLFGGDAGSGALCGLGFSGSYCVPSTTYPTFASRLCFIPETA